MRGSYLIWKLAFADLMDFQSLLLAAPAAILLFVAIEALVELLQDAYDAKTRVGPKEVLRPRRLDSAQTRDCTRESFKERKLPPDYIVIGSGIGSL